MLKYSSFMIENYWLMYVDVHLHIFVALVAVTSQIQFLDLYR